MSRSGYLQIIPGDALAGELDARGSNRNTTAKRDLTRYYTLMSQAIAWDRYTPTEMALVAFLRTEPYTSVLTTQARLSCILYDAGTSLTPKEGKAFTDKIARLSPGTAMALHDYAERTARHG